MKFKPIEPPRVFAVGFGEKIYLRDCAHIELEPDEQVTFFTEAGAEYDVARKNWGFYATPSLNGRLPRFGLRGVLVRNRNEQYFIMLVEQGKEPLFEEYLKKEELKVTCWLDTSEDLERLEQRLRGEP